MMSIRAEQKQQTRQALLNAVLNFTAQGRAFSTLSLREVTREVGLVPATFYRHFESMDQLALELIDQIALYLKSIFHKLCKLALQNPHDHAARVNTLFAGVSERPEYWMFFIHERSSGSQPLRCAIHRESAALIHDFCVTLQKNKDLHHLSADQFEAYAEMFGHITFCLAMGWLDLLHHEDDAHIEKINFRRKAILQIELLYMAMYP